MNDRTLCFPTRGDPPVEVLLGIKKLGFGAGIIAGFGGHIQPGESVEAAAIRELAEETGIQADREDLSPCGHVTFLFPHKPEWSQVVHVFLVHWWQGQVAESHEMKPAWYRFEQIPYNCMWDDAHYWLPIMLQGKVIEGEFVYNDDNKTVGQVRIKALPGSRPD